MNALCAAITLLLALALAGLGAAPASAHPSYAVPQTVLDFGDRRTATLELLYGDGIIFANPARAQLRTPDGATVAKTPMGGSIVTFCPNAEHCWLFLSGPIPIPWRLHPDEIAWNNPPEANPYFPETDETPPVAFARDWTPWSILLGLAMLIIGHWIWLAAMLVPWWLIIAAARWARAFERRAKGQVRWSIALSVVLGLALLAYEFLAVAVMVLERGFPLVTLVIVLAPALYGLLKLSDRFMQRRLNPVRAA